MQATLKHTNRNNVLRLLVNLKNIINEHNDAEAICAECKTKDDCRNCNLFKERNLAREIVR